MCTPPPTAPLPCVVSNNPPISYSAVDATLWSPPGTRVADARIHSSDGAQGGSLSRSSDSELRHAYRELRIYILHVSSSSRERQVLCAKIELSRAQFHEPNPMTSASVNAWAPDHSGVIGSHLTPLRDFKRTQQPAQSRSARAQHPTAVLQLPPSPAPRISP